MRWTCAWAIIAVCCLVVVLPICAQTNQTQPASAKPLYSEEGAGAKALNANTGEKTEPSPVSGAEGLAASLSVPEQGFRPKLQFTQVFDSNVAGGNGYQYLSALSGGLEFYKNSSTQQFAVVYEGGALVRIHPMHSTNQFHSLAISEGFAVNRWTFLLADSLSYTPQAASFGNGVPGVMPIGPVLGSGNLMPGLLPSQNVLTLNSERISNTSVAQASYNISPRSSITAVGSYGLLQFVNDDLMNGRQIDASIGFDHSFSARSSFALKYSYDRFGYAATSYHLDTHWAQFMYRRQLTRTLSTLMSVGPQVVNYNPQTSSHSPLRQAIMFGSYAALLYQAKIADFSLAYTHGVDGGSGIFAGSKADTVSMSVNRTIDRDWAISGTAGYAQTSAISDPSRFRNRYAGAQISRALGRYFGTYFSYTLQSQSQSGPVNNRTFAGRHHVFAIGFDWHPRATRIGK